jgi:hypothetical protein
MAFLETIILLNKLFSMQDTLSFNKLYFQFILTIEEGILNTSTL